MTRLNSRCGRAPRLAVESLEGRDLLSADPLPVLLVIADRQDFAREPAVVRAVPTPPATGYSATVFVAGWGSSMESVVRRTL